MLNPFFLQGSKSEQGLLQDLINETIQIHGVDVYYLPRQYLTKRTVVREVIESRFSTALPIEAYIDTYEGYEGAGVLLSKFGIQPNTDLNLIISKERYESYITPLIKNLPKVELPDRPKEGDLIWFPLGDRLFEIKFVEHETPFYQLQKTYVYNLRCELFRYQDEVIETGLEFIDDNIKDSGFIKIYDMVGVGENATAEASFVDSGVRSVQITNRGDGYSSPPTVRFSNPPSGGTTATGIATMISGIVDLCEPDETLLRVQGVELTNSGIGYPTSAVVDSFKKVDIRFKKYLIHIFDRQDRRDSQALLMNLIHNDISVSISQFAIVESRSNLGNFNAVISGPDLNVIFNPLVTFNKIYSVNLFSFDINDTVEETANLSLGDVCEIQSSSVTAIGSTVITSIPSDYRAGKILVVYSDSIGNTYSGDEINFIRNGSEVIFNNYGEITAGSYSGIGTFGFDSTDLIFYPEKTDIEYSYNTTSILISDETKTQTDLVALSGNLLQSAYEKVDATGTPVKTLIYTYNTRYTASLNLIVIKDLTNGNINYSEILVMLNSLTNEAYHVIFGDLTVGNKIGDFEIETSSVDRSMEIHFTPFNDIDYEVRIFSNVLSRFGRSETLEV